MDNNNFNHPEEIAIQRYRTLVSQLSDTGCRIIDTQVLMDPRERVDIFLSMIAGIVQKHSELRFVVFSSTVEELQKKLVEDENPLASVAINRLERLIELGTAEIVFGGNAQFNDASIVGAVLEAPKRKTAVFTADRALGEDLVNLDKILKSINMVQPDVFVIDGYGFPKRRIITEGRKDRRDCTRGRGFGVYGSFRACGPLTSIPNTPTPAKAVGAGDVVYTKRGGRLRLVPSNGLGGNEASIYFIDGDHSRVVKILKQPTARKVRKIELLTDRNFTIAGAVLPEEAVYDAMGGNLVGFTMPKVRGYTLDQLFDDEYRSGTPAAGWTRTPFTDVAAYTAETAAALASKGILVSDVSPTNIMVDVAPDGSIRDVCLIDLDSAQFGTADEGIIPADGRTPEYVSPELVEKGWNSDTLISKADNNFAWAVMLTTVLMTGMHPFMVQDPSGQLELTDHVRLRQLPYGSSRRRSDGTPPDLLASKLWSQIPRTIKAFLADALTSEAAERPSLNALADRCREYAAWLHGEDSRQFPEADSLAPEKRKPMHVVCCHCGKTFDLANEGGTSHTGPDNKKEFMCAECVDEVIRCESCGKQTYTRGELFRRGIKNSSRFCIECHAKARELFNQNPAAKPSGAAAAALKQPEPRPMPQSAPAPVQAEQPRVQPQDPPVQPRAQRKAVPDSKNLSPDALDRLIARLIERSGRTAQTIKDFLGLC